jgi:hypothetical protein
MSLVNITAQMTVENNKITPYIQIRFFTYRNLCMAVFIGSKSQGTHTMIQKFPSKVILSG